MIPRLCLLRPAVRPVPGRTRAVALIAHRQMTISLFVLARTREAIMNAIPLSLKRAISAGIGLFIALLGLVGAGLVKMNIKDTPSPPNPSRTWGCCQHPGSQAGKDPAACWRHGSGTAAESP